MVNDPCMKGCPARISHASTSQFNKYDCSTIKNRDRINFMFKLGTVYPWYLEYYSALGVNNFRIMPYADKFIILRPWFDNQAVQEPDRLLPEDHPLLQGQISIIGLNHLDYRKRFG